VQIATVILQIKEQFGEEEKIISKHLAHFDNLAKLG
jgi:hypothetical protein